MTWLLWLAACAGCLAIGHILGAGWPDLQVRYVLAREEIKRLTDERDQLRYERRLLAIARLVLDRVSVADTFERARDEAGDVAQRIVDEIGHSVTDEPALGPSFRAVISQCADCSQRLANALPDYEFGDLT